MKLEATVGARRRSRFESERRFCFEAKYVTSLLTRYHKYHTTRPQQFHPTLVPFSHVYTLRLGSSKSSPIGVPSLPNPAAEECTFRPRTHVSVTTPFSVLPW